mgnify:CR=1 FL=1
MPGVLVIQSHRDPLPHPWLQDCLRSVRRWSTLRGFDYRFLGDELFAPLCAEIMSRTREQTVIATDLARLIQLRQALEGGYETVIWCDADFLVFAPERLDLREEPFALGREIWVQQGNRGGLKAFFRVHNAFMMFRRGNSFLDFYIDRAQHLLNLNSGRMPPQFIGPKLLSALHNICYFPVEERAGMLSPLVIEDLLGGGQAALELFRERSVSPAAGANLCSSSVQRNEVTDRQMQVLIQHLLEVREL